MQRTFFHLAIIRRVVVISVLVGGVPLSAAALPSDNSPASETPSALAGAADVQRLATAPLVAACARVGLEAERLLPSLPLADPALTHVIASAFGQVLERSVALDGPVPLFGALLSLRNFPSLGGSAREAARWLEHLRWLDLEPTVDDLAGQTRLAHRLRQSRPERLALTLAALGELTKFSGQLGAAEHILGQTAALSLDDLRRLVDLGGEQITGEPIRHRSLAESSALVQEVLNEGRWRARPAAPTQNFAQAGFGAPVFAMGQAPAPSLFGPAGAGGGGLSEHAREALDVLEHREPAATRPEAVAAALTAAREVIQAAGAAATPDEAAAPPTSGLRRRQERSAEALSALERLSRAAPMTRTTAVRVDRRPLEAGQVFSLIWGSIEAFPANVAPHVAGDRWRELDPTLLAASRVAWRRGLVESLADCASPGAAGGEPYLTVERLLSDLPPFLRSDREVDLETFPPSIAVEQLLAELTAARGDLLAPRQDVRPAEADVLLAWQREIWMGLCEARADRLWSVPDDPRRALLLNRCQQEAERLPAVQPCAQ